MIAQVALFCFISVVAARPQYAVPDYSSPAHEPQVYDETPQPYSFGFNTQDEYGATINQQESGDEHGNKKGSYGYTDGYGVYRQVDYVADEHGFRATVKTNEAGTDNQNPADTEILSEAAPAQYAHSAAAVGPAYAHPAAAVGPAYAHPAAAVAPVYAHPAAPAAPAYVAPVAAVHGPAPVSYESAPVYDSVHAPTPVYGPAPVSYESAPVYDSIHAPAPVYGPAPVYDSVHGPAPVYGPAPVSYAPAPVYEAAPLSYAHGPVYDSAPVYAPAHSSVPVYESVASPVYNGPSYDRLADKASQVNGHGPSYEPEAVESYAPY